VLECLEAFHRAASRVPAYKSLLADANIRPEDIRDMADFARLPVLDKHSTFERFGIAALCLDGRLGLLSSVLTSSGHSGVFAFGLYDRECDQASLDNIDNLLDLLFQVKSQPTLLINCLPMGVKVPTQACTLAETSVRPDMAVALVKAFASQYAQFIFLGEAAFIKHVLELGRDKGVDWSRHRIFVVVGEEPLAENARGYLEKMLGYENSPPDGGRVFSSMGIGEIGLNLFFEVPPAAPLVRLRKTLHGDVRLRQEVLGTTKWVPPLFTYDPRRIYVEFLGDRLVITTLDPSVKVPLIRYAPGDHGGFLRLRPELGPSLEAAGIPANLGEQLPIVMIRGRGKYAKAGNHEIYPEGVKEGIYWDPQLAALATANFRIVSGEEFAKVRIQLSPGVAPSGKLNQRFAEAIARYIDAPFQVACELYESFSSGMSLDYERKFDYLGI
jgi:phenylacetate-CoA ligase